MIAIVIRLHPILAGDKFRACANAIHHQTRAGEGKNRRTRLNRSLLILRKNIYIYIVRSVWSAYGFFYMLEQPSTLCIVGIIDVKHSGSIMVK